MANDEFSCARYSSFDCARSQFRKSRNTPYHTLPHLSICLPTPHHTLHHLIAPPHSLPQLTVPHLTSPPHHTILTTNAKMGTWKSDLGSTQASLEASSQEDSWCNDSGRGQMQTQRRPLQYKTQDEVYMGGKGQKAGDINQERKGEIESQSQFVKTTATTKTSQSNFILRSRMFWS